MDNYLSAESLIIERLRTQVTGVRAVLSAADLAGVEEAKQVTPALHVLYDGDDLGDRAADGADGIVRQRWLVIVAVRNARGQASGAGAREVAGPIILQVLAALGGWQPDEEHGELVRIAAPRPAFSPGGFAYFPLAFHTAISP